jgi:hypothetical protein
MRRRPGRQQGAVLRRVEGGLASGVGHGRQGLGGRRSSRRVVTRFARERSELGHGQFGRQFVPAQLFFKGVSLARGTLR